VRLNRNSEETSLGVYRSTLGLLLPFSSIEGFAGTAVICLEYILILGNLKK
jgi:hypothetical protein